MRCGLLGRKPNLDQLSDSLQEWFDVWFGTYQKLRVPFTRESFAQFWQTRALT
jgi:hypothetical protein